MKAPAPPSPPLPAGKRRVFWILTLAAPCIALVALELFLRLTGLCREEPFLTTVSDGRQEFYQINPWVARRYFDPHKVSVPSLRGETFPKVKPAGTLRVFCLGESTTAGFPFEGGVPFPKQLHLLLSRSFPSRRIEVINTGISAMSSYTVLDLLPEMLQAKPDLLIIYLGHNEFYGAYGSGSTVSLGGNDALVRLFIRIQKFHVVQMLRTVVQWGEGLFAHEEKETTLMGAVVREQEIPYGSDRQRRTERAFANNLERILQMAQEKGVKVIIGTLFSNVGDQRPLRSAAAPGREGTSSEALHVAERVLQGESGTQEGARGALQRLEQAIRGDSLNADLYYMAGRLALRSGDTARATTLLTGAKERDLMRFRASEDVNTIITTAAQKYNASLTPLEELFRQQSPGGIIGSSLLCDHLHPDPNGYYMMALAFYRTILSLDLLGAPDSSFVPQTGPYHVTDLDWNIGLIKVFELTHRWPFPERPIRWSEFRPHGDPLSARFALNYITSRTDFSAVHDSMAVEQLRHGANEAAREEYRSESVFAPDDPDPYLRIAKTYETEGRWAEREEALTEALLRSPAQGMILYQIALSRWKQGKLPGAIQAMEVAAEAPEFSRAERHNALFFLAGFLSDMKRNDAAVRVLRLVLSEDPSFAPARQFLARLERGGGATQGFHP